METPFGSFKHKAVIVMGFPKSGTSLFTSLLDHHPQLLVVPFELNYAKIAYRDRALSSERWREKIIAKSGLDAMGTKITGNFERDYSDLDREKFMKALKHELKSAKSEKERFLSVIKSFYFVEHSDKRDKRAWVEKTPTNYLLLPLFASWFGDNLTCFHIVRDPLDNFVSYKKFPGNADVRAFSEEWKFSNIMASMGQKASPNYHIIRYEKLVREPERQMRVVADILGIRYEASLIEPTWNGKQWHGNSVHGDHFNVVSLSPVGRYRNILTEQEISHLRKLLYGFDLSLSLALLKRQLFFFVRWHFQTPTLIALRVYRKIKQWPRHISRSAHLKPERGKN
jgi:hypothetical protein